MNAGLAHAMPATQPARVVQRIRIDDANWQTYEQFLAAVGDRPLKVTYDRGRLEIMAPLRIHEREKRLLGRLIETLTLQLKLPLESCGSMTIRRADLDRGFEPGECYYIAHASQMLALRKPDFTCDPPPDLAIEIDNQNSSLDRQALYAALGIPELWHFDGELTILHLEGNQTYRFADASRSFPFLRQADVSRFLKMLGKQSETAILTEFCTWLQTAVPPTCSGPGGAASPAP